MPTITAGEFLLTTDDYRRMAEAGILGPEDRVELIDGRVVPMSPVGASHLFCVNALTRLFAEHTGSDIEVSVQNPVQLGPHQEPEPDVALLHAAAEPRVPGAGDALLVVEVADATYPYDRQTKLPLYAGSGIPQVWIFNLPERRLEAYARPAEDAYTERTVYAPEDRLALPPTDHVVSLADVLP